VDRAYDRRLITGYPPLLLFTDSLLVVGALEWGWSISNLPGISTLLDAYRARKALNPTRLYWVKGHADIKYNEEVDVLAKQGARRSQKGEGPTTITNWTRHVQTSVPPPSRPYAP
jgi:ribonuclease HI